MNEPKNEWWRQEGAMEIYRGESDGQQFTAVFVRDTIIYGLEYAVVQCSDGDYVEHVFGGVTLRGAQAVPIPADR